MGTDSYVTHILDEKIDELEEEVKTICQVLENERQAELRKPASSTSTLAEHLGTYPGTLKPKNNI